MGLGLAALILQACGADETVDADAPARKALAARAIAEAKSMPRTYHRDIVLRSISRNLRWVDCDLAREAAAAMDGKGELQGFGRCPDATTPPSPRPDKVEEPVCTDDMRRLIAESSGADRERRIRDYFDIGGPPRVVYPPPCSYEATMMAADALPPGENKVALLFRAMSENLPNTTPDRRRTAVDRLRALLPELDGDVRKRTEDDLDTMSVDLIEGRPDAAIDRVRQAFRNPDSVPGYTWPEQEAYQLTVHFLHAKDIERAVTVTRLLPPSDDCRGMKTIWEWALPQYEREGDEAEGGGRNPVVGVYFDRLQAAGLWNRLCPKGVARDIDADAWLRAGKQEEALAAAAATGIPIRLARMRAEVADRRLRAGNREGAQPVILAALAAAPALDTGTAMDRATAAGTRIRIIDQLVQIGEVEEAERLAAAFPGPGWRGFAYSVIAETKARLAGRKAATFVRNLSEVPTDR